MTPPTVLVLGPQGDASLEPLARAGDRAHFVLGSRPEDFTGDAARAQALFLSTAGGPVFERVFAMAPRLRWVHVRSAGLDGVLFPALIESTTVVTNSRGVYSGSLAEFVLAAMLHFGKDLRRMVRSQESGLWDPFDVQELKGQTLGIVGYGDIGRSIADRARGLHMRVLAMRRRAEPSDDPGVDEFLPADRIQDLMRRSDYVAVALPLTPETRGMIGAEQIGAMKGSAVLVNVGRGATVDEAALIQALQAGRIRGAALDVFETEPLPAGHAFYRLGNVLLSPHCSDHTPTWRGDGVGLFLDNLELFLTGEPLRNVVDKGRGY